MNAQVSPTAVAAVIPVSVAPPSEESRHFTPRAKHPVLELSVSFQTEPVEKISDSNFEPVQKALYHIMVTLPIMSRDDTSVIHEVHALIEKRFETIEKKMADEVGRLKALAKTDGAVQPSTYTNLTPKTIQVFTPEMARWVGLLTRMDEIMRWTDALWFSTRVKAKDRSAVIMNWRNTITGFSRELHNLHLRALSHLERTTDGTDKPTSANGYIKELVAEVKRGQKREGSGAPQKAPKSPKAPRAAKPAETKPAETTAVVAAATATVAELAVAG